MGYFMFRFVLINQPNMEEGKKWEVSFGAGSNRKRNTASTIFLAIQRHLSPRTLKEKIAVRVKYEDSTTNETLGSQNKAYLLYATSCFLEDYLSQKVLLRVEREWLKAGEIL